MNVQTAHMHHFLKDHLLYDDGTHYSWTSPADPHDPFYTCGACHKELQRQEGHDMLHFINYMGKTHWNQPPLEVYQRMELLIRCYVPKNLVTHKQVADWILNNWNK